MKKSELKEYRKGYIVVSFHSSYSVFPMRID